MNFDELLEEIGPFGPYQIYMVVLIGLVQLPVGANHLASVFLAGLPTYHCSDSTGDHHNDTVTSSSSDAGDDSACFASSVNGSEPVACTEWTYDTDVYESTIASEVSSIIGARTPASKLLPACTSSVFHSIETADDISY